MIKWHDDPQLVIVVWEDAVNLASWHDLEEIEEFYSNKPQMCTNVGYFIGEDETGIYIAARSGHYNDLKDAWGLIERLPRGMIREVTQLHTGICYPIDKIKNFDVEV